MDRTVNILGILLFVYIKITMSVNFRSSVNNECFLNCEQWVLILGQC